MGDLQDKVFLVAGHAVPLPLRGQRPHLGLRVERIVDVSSNTYPAAI